MPILFQTSSSAIHAAELTADSDSGAQLRDEVINIESKGDSLQKVWPYNINKFAEKPPQACFKEAVNDKAVEYQRVIRDLNQMKGCLASGYPFVFGFSVYQSFESQHVAKTGKHPCRHTPLKLFDINKEGFQGQRMFLPASFVKHL
jgi:hypothetical protein